MSNVRAGSYRQTAKTTTLGTCAIALGVWVLVIHNHACADTSAPPATKKAAPAPAPADAPNWGEIFKLHYKNRVKSFREQNKDLKTSKNVILLGDSITEGFDIAKYFP